MKPEKQRIKIAEACGWQVFSIRNGNYKLPNGDWECGVPLPDYLNDLNAMHEAEKTLDHPEAFAARLGPILLRDKCASNYDGTTAWHFAFAHATAAQRAEAFLRTIGTWTEE